VLRLTTESSDPRLSIADVVGRLTIDGHTLDVDLSRIRFPGTQFSAKGSVQWPHDTLLWNLAMRADSATLTDIQFLDPRFPENAVLHGGVMLASHGGGCSRFSCSRSNLSVGQGRLTGHINAFSAADSGLVALPPGRSHRAGSLARFRRVYIDSLPFHGRLTGQTIVDGPMSALKIETRWSFRDSLVPGWPESQIQGKGEISLGGPALAFQPFAVETGRIDIGTIRRLVPGFDLQGELDATGTLTGTLKNATFSGTLRHHDGERPSACCAALWDSTLAPKSSRLQRRSCRFTLARWADRADRAFPDARQFDRTIRTSGNVAALETHVDLDMLGGGGAVRGDGTLLLGARGAHPGFGARNFTLRAQDVNLQRWLARNGPPRGSHSVPAGPSQATARPRHRERSPPYSLRHCFRERSSTAARRKCTSRTGRPTSTRCVCSSRGC